MLIRPPALKTVNSIEKMHPRMIVVTFNGSPRATINSCYSPTNVSEETKLIAFNKLSSLVRTIPKHNVPAIGSGVNSQTSSKCNRMNPTNTNALILKKAQNEIASIYIKEQTEYIQNQIDKIRDSVEDRQSWIT